jgi:hypothetical protein
VTKVSPSCSTLVYSTYLGGSDADYSNAITLDGSGSAYIAGNTHSSDFLTNPGAYDTTIDDMDVFISKISEPSQDWTTTITYTLRVRKGQAYDPLYRLTQADYSTGEYFTYTLRVRKGQAYDAVGNWLSETTNTGTTTCTLRLRKGQAYDNANRLTSVDGVTYILHFVQDRLPQGMRDSFWDNNGNLLSDGVSTYTLRLRRGQAPRQARDRPTIPPTG